MVPTIFEDLMLDLFKQFHDKSLVNGLSVFQGLPCACHQLEV